MGHWMRCLALSHAWRDRGGGVAFAVGASTPETAERLVGEGVSVERVPDPPGSPGDAEETARVARRRLVRWVVVDGYCFGPDYLRTLRDAGLAVVRIEDRDGEEWEPADVILNQNASASESSYRRRASGARLLLGTRYTLLRREFERWRGWRHPIAARAQRILVTTGGSDPGNLTLRALRALRDLDRSDLAIRVVAGPMNPHGDALRRELESFTGVWELATAVDDMSEPMAWADLAISAAGSTCWELAFMGVPMIVIPVAENQRPIAESLEEAGAAVRAGWDGPPGAELLAHTVRSLIPDSEKRAEMSRRGREMVDGLGARRVAEALQWTPTPLGV